MELKSNCIFFGAVVNYDNIWECACAKTIVRAMAITPQSKLH